VSVVARQYNVNTNQVFAWRKLFGAVPNAPSPLKLVPLVLTPGHAGAAPPGPPADTIEIELASGHRVRIGCAVKPAFLRLVLDALERR
jgi:transposase